MAEWTAEFYEDRHGKRPAENWMDDLDEIKFAAMNAAILHVLEPNGLELGRTEWLKPLGDGLHEFRVRHTPREIISMFADEGVPVPEKVPVKILLRLFVHFHGTKVILLLSGYDKGDDPSEKQQQREIAKAKKLLTAWRLAQAAEKKRRK
jgi:putative component of toxin-antitoxin plasmid stabilization module